MMLERKHLMEPGRSAPRRDGTVQRWRRLGVVAATLLSTPAAAQTAAAPTDLRAGRDAVSAPSAKTPTESVVINLIELLVEQGVLTRDKADALIRQARVEAAAAKREAETAAKQQASERPVAAQAPPPRAPAASRPPVAAIAGAPEPAGPPMPESLQTPPSVVRVPYIPEIVKRQIADQVKQDVLQTAQRENWAQPGVLPEWLARFKFFGDIRLRYEYDRFDPSNAPFVNFQAINAGNPVDISNNPELPLVNTTQDRQRLRLRARLGVEAGISDDFLAGLGFGTGNINTPVSTNQTLGNDFNNLSFVINRAYLQYAPDPSLTLWGGRMPNPWLSTDLLWATDLAFDGVAGTYRYQGLRRFTPFLTLGAFSVENTALNFPATGLKEAPSRDKWLFSAQAGFDHKLGYDSRLRLGVAYYYFQNLQGAPSSPCLIVTLTSACSSDLSRPGFMQAGNTLFAIRNVLPNTLGPGGTSANPQFFGLASPFRELNATAQLDVAADALHHIIVDGDFVTNLGFRRSRVLDLLNSAPANNNGGQGIGNIGAYGQVTYGTPQVADRWDWNVSAGYKYIESDAVVDAFNSPDFHLGGTNAKGFILGGNLGIARNVWLSGHWFSTSQVSGPPLVVDVFQVDLNGRF